MNNYKDKEFLGSLMGLLVEFPEEVRIERTIDERGVLLSLRVHPKDMARIIGKQGATAKAIRTLLNIVGIKNNSRVSLKIEEPESSVKKIELG